MTPRLIWNRWRYGRFLDVLISHAPPRDINDREDVTHRGFRPLRRFLRWFKPAVHLHGHIHIYDRTECVETRYHDSTVINVYPYKRIELATTQRSRAERVDPAVDCHV